MFITDSGTRQGGADGRGEAVQSAQTALGSAFDPAGGGRGHTRILGDQVLRGPWYDQRGGSNMVWGTLRTRRDSRRVYNAEWMGKPTEDTRNVAALLC